MSLVARVYCNAIAECPDKTFTAFNDIQINWDDPEKYEISHKLGQGKYSEVFCGYDTSDLSEGPEGKKVVIKVLKPVKFQRIKKELKLLQNVAGGPNILRMIALVRDPIANRPCMVLEHVDAVDFKDHFPKMPYKEVCFYLYSMCKALDYCHSIGIMHRDVKPHNTVYDPKRKLFRLIDFGLADFYIPGTEYSLRVASRYFKAVELFLGYTNYDYSSDLWSVGVVAAQMIFVKYPFFKGKRTDENQLLKIIRVLGTEDLDVFLRKYGLTMADSCISGGIDRAIPKRSWQTYVNETNEHLVSAEALDFIDRLLCYDHQERLTAREAMEHPYLAEIRAADVAGRVPEW